MLNEVNVVQLGHFDYSIYAPEGYNIKWNYEPDFSILKDAYIDVLLLFRDITEDEYLFLSKNSKAYCVFFYDGIDIENSLYNKKLYYEKCGKVYNENQMIDFVKNVLFDFYSSSYGEKVDIINLFVSQKFNGSIKYNGYEDVELNGDFGDSINQIVFWKYNIPIYTNQSLEFWLEYEKEGDIELFLTITQFASGSSDKVDNKWSFSENELKDVVVIKNHKSDGSLFFSIKAKGTGKLRIISLHNRFSRRNKGSFIIGGQRKVLSNREEILYYFDPGNYKPPLNVYFSGYRTQEGYEGYNMLRRLKHPFIIFTDARLEGGGFYIGNEEYENAIVHIIERHAEVLKFNNSDIILSGMSMGSFGALYYGCNIKPHAIIVGKPLVSLGDVARNEQVLRSGEFPTSLDVLHKNTGGTEDKDIEKLNNKFWNKFDKADWSNTEFAIAYMKDDDYDANAYNNLQEHLDDLGAIIYGKGLSGKHNDDTSGIIRWFLGQYESIIDEDFDNKD